MVIIKKQKEVFYLSKVILDKIRASGIFLDSKTFVDMPIKVDFTQAVEDKLLNTDDPKELLKLLKIYFNEPGCNELQNVPISDNKKEPKFISNIKDPEYKDWALHLCKIWGNLVRKINPEVQTHEENHSLIYMEKPFVVPGGRFREMYYWDTYWSIIGLLHSEMFDIVKGILENFLSLVERYGFVPNGGRKYYENRSQPPFLTLMVKEYYDATGDEEFVRICLPTLIKEHIFWMSERTVEVNHRGRIHIINHYSSSTSDPRPESYKEDLATMINAGHEENLEEQKNIFSDIVAAAESGWDFSSRWFKEPYEMETIHTRDIIPVDLNVVLCAVEFTLASFCNDILHQSQPADQFQSLAERRLNSMDDLFWNNEYGLWCDYDLSTNKTTSEFYASAFFPLWLTKFSSTCTIHRGKAFQKIKELGVLSYAGGLPTSLIESGEQWDFPNAWAPLQHIAVQALDPVTSVDNTAEMNQAGKDLAKRFLENAYISWKTTGHMYEKYDVTEYGKAGSGGEYDVQEGFGWTNGVILDFLHKYGHELVAPKLEQ